MEPPTVNRLRPVLLLALFGCSENNYYQLPNPAACETETFPPEALEVDPSCLQVETGTFSPVVEWNVPNFMQNAASAHVVDTPIVVQLSDDNGDGAIDERDVPDIAFVTYETMHHELGGTIRALSGDGGAEVLTAAIGEIDGFAQLAAGDIDNDGMVELVARTDEYEGYRVMAFEHDGTWKWTSEDLASADVDGVGPACSIADMDGDGSPEIVLGRVILDAHGDVVGVGEYGKGVSGPFGPTSFAVDLDVDGELEVITGNAAYRKDGTAKWHVNQPDGFVAVGDFDADGQGEVVVVSTRRVRLLDTDGTKLWETELPSSGTDGGAPTVADFDGDGLPEVGVAGNGYYAVFDTDGTLMWRQDAAVDLSGVTGSSVFDFEGDGVAEVVYADEERIFVLSGPTGEIRMESDAHTSLTGVEYAIVADVDADGQAEIVTGNGQSRGGRWGSGISVIGDLNESWMPATPIWNQFAYHITNIEPDGTVPAVPEVNWGAYNSFRSGAMVEPEPIYKPDLVLRVDGACEVRCRADMVQLWVRVGNQGRLDALGVEVALIVETPDGEIEVDREPVGRIAPGQLRESVELFADGVDLAEVTDVIVRIVPPEDATWTECAPWNDQARLGPPACE